MYDEDFDEPCALVSSSVNRTLLSSTAAAAVHEDAANATGTKPTATNFVASAAEYLASNVSEPKSPDKPEE